MGEDPAIDFANGLVPPLDRGSSVPVLTRRFVLVLVLVVVLDSLRTE